MKKLICVMLCIIMLLSLTALSGCGKQTDTTQPAETPEQEPEAEQPVPEDIPEESPEAEPSENPGETEIILADDVVTVNGEPAGEDESAAVYTARDIVFYPEGQDFTFGEGGPEDEHSQEEADGHTVVHITKPGSYRISGSLTGQIAVDLGDEAEEDPAAVVTLILDGAEINCSVAPGIIFYKVYECCSAEEPGMTVDTSAAGANIVLADGSVNTVNGSYVAKIYKSVTLSEDGTEVTDSKKLHKYDGAVYSKKSMNVSGGGTLNINAENEGLDSEMHLTINGGVINIVSGNDGINTNEDGVSVTTVNGGELTIVVSGATGEGDGIDSNGWLVINGGTVKAFACSTSGDSGIDSDMGIYLNGGTVIAAGNMLDAIAGSEQNYAVFSFSSRQSGGKTYTLTDADGAEVISCTPENDFSELIICAPELAEGDYGFTCEGEPLSGVKRSGGMMQGGMMTMPGGEPPEKPENLPQVGEPPEKPENMPQMGEPPEKSENIEGSAPPEKPENMGGGERPEPPEGGFDGTRPGGPGGFGGFGGETVIVGDPSVVFTISEGGNYFSIAA